MAISKRPDSRSCDATDSTADTADAFGARRSHLAVDHVTPKRSAAQTTHQPRGRTRLQTNGKSSVGPDAQTVADVDQAALDWAPPRQRAIDLLRPRRRSPSGTLVDRQHVRGSATGGHLIWHPAAERATSGSGPTITVFLGEGPGPSATSRRLFAEADQAQPGQDRPSWRYFCGCCWRFLDDAKGSQRAGQ